MGYDRWALQTDYHEGLPGPNTQEEFAYVREAQKMLREEATEQVHRSKGTLQEAIYRTKAREQEVEYQRQITSSLEDALEELEKEKLEKEKIEKRKQKEQEKDKDK